MITTDRLQLVPASIHTITSAIEDLPALGARLDAVIPSSWPPDLLDRDALEWTLRWLSEPSNDPAWGFHWVVLREPRTLVGVAVVPMLVALVERQPQGPKRQRREHQGKEGLREGEAGIGDERQVDCRDSQRQQSGRTPDEAHGRTHGSDERNAELVAATRDRADLLVVESLD